MFALSLDHIPQKWFFKQEPSNVATWEEVTRVFVARYQCNVEADSLHRKLDILKQRENEGFTEFYNRWTTAAAQMIDPLKEPVAVKKIIENLHEDYQKHLRLLPLSNYRSLYEVGVNIENYMMKKKPTNNNSGWKGKKNDTPSSSKPNYSNNNNVNDVWAVDNQKPRTQRKRREFIPIGMS